MSKLKEAAENFLESYDSENPEKWLDGPELIEALRQALASSAPEPVAWRTFDGEGGYDYRSYEHNEDYSSEWRKLHPHHKDWVEPLYTEPPQRQWVGLTDELLRSMHHEEEFGLFCDYDEFEQIYRAIEAKLKGKNHDRT